MCCARYLSILLSIPWVAAAAPGEFADSGWAMRYQENFDTEYEATDGQTFGDDDWLTFQLVAGGSISVANGYAHINTSDFQNAALIRSTAVLPDVYKLRTKIGHINYDLTEYEPEDLVHPDFNTHSGAYENGMYFLTVTDALCSGLQCAEDWWHYHRKMVIDVDNHINLGTGDTVAHPVYMVYMAPEVNAGGNLLRTWDGAAWDTSPWNWNRAYTYESAVWYYAELEKGADYLILRLYDENRNLLVETSPVDLSLVFAMDGPASYLYLGEPHTDDYEGDVWVDEITLLVPETDCCTSRVGDANGIGGDEPSLGDVSVMIDAQFISGTCVGLIDCLPEADINQSGGLEPTCDDISIGDISALIDYLSITQAASLLPGCL